MQKIYPDNLMPEKVYENKIRETKIIREREFIKKSRKLYSLVEMY